MNEFNFFASSVESDKDLFFGPVELEDTFIVIEENWTMANIMTVMGIFPSISQARKNGWNKSIPEGFSDMRVGKSKTRITIYKEKFC